MKCDEAKPACQRCIRSKRECAGYTDITVSDIKPQAFKITYYVPQISSVSWKTGISEKLEEEHALDCFFYWNTKCFPSELTEPFRQQDILHEPAIRHAMVAMGILHEIRRYQITGPPETQRRIIAMQHYGKAIQSLISRQNSDTYTLDGSKKTKSISLLACLLFVALEASQGRHQSALAHLQSGFALFQGVLSDEQHTSENDSYVSERILRSFFVRYMCQITHFDLPDCARFLELSDSADEYSAGFPDLEVARESFLAILNKILSRRQTRHIKKQPGLNDYGDDIQQNQSISDELLELDRWIFSFNLYLTHGVPTSQVCDAYVLATCAFSLKFRLLVESRAGEQASGTTEIDLTHIANLGDVFFKASPSPTTFSTCPLHQLFDGTNYISRDKNNNDCPTTNSTGSPLFPFLGVFCSIFVSSTYSQNDSIRRKSYDTVSKICRCGKGIDMGLAIYIASLLRPADKDESTFARSIDHSPVVSQALSEGCWKLLKVLHSFGNF